ncbi:class II aldolase/adducin family protein [Methylobacterium sp. E-065]|uniref:class II aldolase/adducin family protein n=1 Tax=unclassified Methylobacterium TaxID=2615210 RepID=UPI001FB9A464|nr:MULTISPECIES: class II aldolase/adducin family protein [unclassified Methylobacterium]MCJ2020626.1 class II aldolase/adducin family protein [Methylobacterium sp. E-065]MCJ2116749.1 class II aldolase/adducin family protein [Methylobacterium sp. J-001]
MTSGIAELQGKRYDLDLPSMRDRVSPKEWEARVNLAACYRLVALWDMTDMIANHISVRVPGEPEHFLINAYGLLYEEISASNLVKIDFDGNIVDKPDFDYGVNRAGFVIHSAVHRARHEVDCVIHTHTPAGMAISAMKCGLLPMTQTAMRFSTVAYHDYEGVAVDLDEQKRIVDDLGEADLMILRNHGLLVVGPTVPQAFSNIYRAELACKAQLMAMAASTDLVLPSDEVIAKTNHLYRPEVRRPFGVLEWPALLRKLDRIDPTYRD